MVSTMAIGLLFYFCNHKSCFCFFQARIRSRHCGLSNNINSRNHFHNTLLHRSAKPILLFTLFRGDYNTCNWLHTHLSCFIFMLKDNHEPEFIKTIRESLMMLIVVATLVTLTGTIFKSISNFAANRKEIYTIYPALINLVSNVGSVVGSTANTKLAFGILKPTFSSIKNHTKNIISAWAASLIICTILALISLAINHVFQLTNLINFMVNNLVIQHNSGRRNSAHIIWNLDNNIQKRLKSRKFCDSN